MHVPQQRRRHSIDYVGIVTVSLGLTAVLTATMSGGSEWAWSSWQVIGLYAAGALLLAMFVWNEARAPEPLLPLGLWRNGIFTWSNVANMCVAMSMFGVIYFLPVFVQGVTGNSATNSGTILVPMLLAMVVTSILGGMLISRTGRYKLLVIAGLVVMGMGYFLLTRMDVHTDNGTVVRNMVLIGLGLGTSMQTYTLIVQNSVSRSEMGVATSATQLFRSVGAAIGVAVMGTVLTQSLNDAIPRHLPPAAVKSFRSSAGSAGSVLDPSLLSHLPPLVAAGIRAGLSDALHNVFVVGLPFIAIALVASFLIREIPLRRTAHVEEAVEAGLAAPRRQPTT